MIGKKKEITSSSKLCMVHGNVISNRRNIEFQELVKADIPARELRHRINVFSEGVWFLMSNMIVLQGVNMISVKRKD